MEEEWLGESGNKSEKEEKREREEEGEREMIRRVKGRVGKKLG